MRKVNKEKKRKYNNENKSERKDEWRGKEMADAKRKYKWKPNGPGNNKCKGKKKRFKQRRAATVESKRKGEKGNDKNTEVVSTPFYSTLYPTLLPFTGKKKKKTF